MFVGFVWCFFLGGGFGGSVDFWGYCFVCLGFFLHICLLIFGVLGSEYIPFALFIGFCCFRGF